MALQTSGAISLHQINVELGLSGTAQISLNDAAVRKLLEKPSGTISMYDAYGKTATLNAPPSTLCAVLSLYPVNQE